MATYNKKLWTFGLLLVSVLIALMFWLCPRPSPPVVTQPNAGYAVIIEGSYFAPGSTQELSTNKSAELLYQTLLSRGFTEQQIIYLGQDDTRPGVDAFASMENLDSLLVKKASGDSISSLLEQITNKPAQVHFFLVGNAGRGGNFYLNVKDEVESEILNATQLDTWLDTLEQIPQVANWPRTVTIATPYSAGFIPALSNASNASGRVIVASTTAAGRAFMGPEEQDGVPAASYFLSELLEEWGRGKNLDESFNLAAKRTRELTRADDSSFTRKGQYVENALQQPLLDDNADGVGTWRNTPFSDGEVASTVFLGLGQTEADDAFVVPEPQFLSAPGTSRLSVNGTGASRKQWAAAVRVPGTKLLSTPNPAQGKLPYKRVDLSASNVPLYEASYDFTQSGRYEIWYWGEGENGKDTVSKRAVVLVNAASNTSPNAFVLEFPGKNMMDKNTPALNPSVFEWSQALDPDGDAVWYQAMISKSPKLDKKGQLSSVLHKSDELKFLAWVVEKDLKLKQEEKYYIQVLSYDRYGKITATKAQGFVVLAVVAGRIISGQVNAPTGAVEGAAIRWNDSTINDAGLDVVSKLGGFYNFQTTSLLVVNPPTCESGSTLYKGKLGPNLTGYRTITNIDLSYCNSVDLLNHDFDMVVDVDTDGDGIPNSIDNCAGAANADQLDSDGDLIGDACDNCTLVSNSDQRDTDTDGYGNMCDGDLNNDGRTNTLDLNLYKQSHRTRVGDANYNPDADFNGDGRINTLDLNIYNSLHRKLPGPSGLVP